MFFFKRKNKVTIIPREQHCLSRKDIDPDALKVLYRLASLNYEAYLVGGSVRDLLLGRKPKDFDVGTDARPNEIRRVFRNCFLIGKRFRLAHIVFGKKVIETATFRKAPDANSVADEHGLYQYEDNTYGTPEEDALRRDFTVNGLFYDIKTFAIIDWVNGLKDLQAKVIRCIGDPDVRFEEDPVRMMRAVRFAAKLGFTVCSSDVRAIRKHAPALANASVSRLCEEIMRLFVKGASERSIRLSYEYGLLRQLLPSVTDWMDLAKANAEAVFASLRALDEATEAEGFESTAAVAFAAMLWPMVSEAVAAAPSGRRRNDRFARRCAAQEAFAPIVAKYKLPRAVWMTAVDLLELHSRFWEQPNPASSRDARFVMHPVWPEAWMFARALIRVTPDRPWKLDAWRAYSESLGNRMGKASDGERPRKPHARRRRPRRRKGGDRGNATQPAATAGA